jgi:hypothetical protein
MEKHFGRLLKKGEQVHHISGDKKDNREINLFVCNNSEHLKAHDKRHVA